jgi:type IV pilus assembly protein PilQ
MNMRSLVSSALSGLLLVGLVGWSAQAAPVAPSLDNRVSIDAQDANLADVLAVLAQQSGYNIVTGSELSADEEDSEYGRITLHVKNTPISEALDLVVRAAGLSYEKVGNSFLVATPAKISTEVGLNSYVIPLSYVSATEIKEMIKDLTTNAQVDTSNNAVILRTSTKVLEEVREVVSQVDRPVPQVMLEAKLIEVVVDDQEMIGVDWSRLNKITNILAENGKVRQDWMIPDDWGNPGSDQGWKNNRGGPWLWMNELQVAQGFLPNTAPFQPLNMDNMGHFSRQMTAFDITLNFMLRNNKASILASSKVATLNNRPANISVVDVVSYVFNAGGQTQQITVKEQEVGIVLNILPHINPEGWITTEVSPEVSSITDWKGPNADIPQVKRRTAKTTVRVKDGESIIIAGLLDTQKTKVVNRLPILSRMPFIGALFRSNDERIRKTDLVIQITPRILTPEGEWTETMPQVIREIEDELKLDDLIKDNDN